MSLLRMISTFSRYYEGIYILFTTGLRISEFVGSNDSLILISRVAKSMVDHQLTEKKKYGVYH